MRRTFALLATLLFAAAACSTATPPAASPSGPEKVTITNTTSAELLAVYNASQTALSNKDLTGFQATIDLTRAAFRRCQSETVDIANAGTYAAGLAAAPRYRAKLRSLKQVRATLSFSCVAGGVTKSQSKNVTFTR